MKKRLHGFDIDGVVTKMDRLVASLGLEYKGFEDKHLVTYSIAKSLMLSGFIETEKEFDERGFFGKYSKHIHADVCLADGFLEYYNSLTKAGDGICFITARTTDEEQYTRELFARHGIAYENVYHVGGTYGKDALVHDLGVNVFYEDNLETGLRVAEHGDIEVIIYDAPYNQMTPFPYATMTRIKHWQEMIEMQPTHS